MIVTTNRKPDPYNLPNLISLMRLLTVPLIVWLIIAEQFSYAFWIFIAAGISDGVDGFLAKHFDTRTKLGAYLDPIADKTLLVSVFIALGAKGIVPSWLVILVVSRDFLIIGAALLSWMLEIPFKVQPLFLSKVNTACQIVMIGVVLGTTGYDIAIAPVSTVLIYLTGGLTVSSGAQYLWNWKNIIIHPPTT